MEVRGCPRWDAWLSAGRDALRELRLDVLGLLIERTGRSGEALAWARERLTVDPFSEELHGSVMALLGRLGRVREGLDQFEACRRMLDGQYGLRPSPELLRLRAGLAWPVDLAIASPRSESTAPLDARALRVLAR